MYSRTGARRRCRSPEGERRWSTRLRDRTASFSHGLKHAGKHVAHAHQDGEPLGVLSLCEAGVLEGGESVDPHDGREQLHRGGDLHLEVDPGAGDLVGFACNLVLHDLATVAQVSRAYAAALQIVAILFLLSCNVSALDLVGQLGDHPAQRRAELGLGSRVLIDLVDELSCCRVPLSAACSSDTY